MTCLDKQEIGDELLSKVLTQYRESPKLLGVIRESIEKVVDASNSICELPEKHEILTAVGDQLTNVGKRMGWPRCHCVCSEPGPVFAWSDAPTNPTRDYVGFCDPAGSWEGCEGVGSSEICFNDDEAYRGYLLARRFQALQLYDIDSLQAAAQHIWGENASAYSQGGGDVVVSVGRALTATENRQLPLAFRVLPIAPGIRPFVDKTVGPLWGFGEGWASLCGGVWSCPEPIDPYNC